MAIGKILRKGLAFSNVVASGVASCLLPIGRTIERITLAMGGTTFNATHITSLRLRANGKVIIDLTGPELLKINAFRGITRSVVTGISPKRSSSGGGSAVGKLQRCRN